MKSFRLEDIWNSLHPSIIEHMRLNIWHVIAVWVALDFWYCCETKEFSNEFSAMLITMASRMGNWTIEMRTWKKSEKKSLNYMWLGWTSIWRCLINVVLKGVIKNVSTKFIFFVELFNGDVMFPSWFCTRGDCHFQSFSCTSLFIVDASK